MKHSALSTQHSALGARRMPAKRRQGFTLVELVLVIILIAILASIAVPRFVNLSRQADIAATRGALGAVRGALVMDYASRTLVNRGVAKFANVVYHSWFMEIDVPVNEISNSSRVVNASGSEVTTVTGEPGQVQDINMNATNTPIPDNLAARAIASINGAGGATVFCCNATQTCVTETTPSIGWVYESEGNYEGIVKPCGDNSTAAGFTDDTADVW